MQYPSCKKAEEDIHHTLNCEERAHKTNEIFMREIQKNYKNLQDQENMLDQIIKSVRQSDNHMNSNWNLENQTPRMGFIFERTSNQGMAGNHGKTSSK